MKKIYLLFFIIISLFTAIFSEDIYGIYIQDSLVGTSTVNFDKTSKSESTITEMSLGLTKAKYISKTVYNTDWSVKYYSLDIFVNGVKQITSSFNYLNGTFSGNANGLNLSRKKIKNPVILDNNIIGHMYALLFMETGKYNVLIPSLMFNSSTDKSSVMSMEITEKSENILKYVYSGLEVIINTENNEIISAEIPAQKVKYVKGSVAGEFTEKQISFSSNGIDIPGTIMFPKESKEKYPAIVLVHGSGPNDRDETIQSGSLILKPFYELSKNLAENGFVVLRYDKRSYLANFDKSIKNITVNDFVTDAENAFNYLYSQDFTDKDSVFVLGHSQGASFVPIIIKNLPVKAGISFAPALLDIFSQIVYQTDYQYEQLKNIKGYEQVLTELSSIKKQAEEAKNKFESGNYSDSDTFLGADFRFYAGWMNLQKDPVKDFINSEKKILILNGENDLKTPYPLIKEKENVLLQNKNITVKYLQNTIHEMYNPNTMLFNSEIGKIITSYCMEK